MIRISATGQPDSFCRKGFTLIEVLVVLTITAVMVASLSLGGVLRKNTLKNQVEDIRLNLQLLRHQAQLQGVPTRAVINVAENRLIFADQVVELGADIDLTVTGGQRQREGESILSIVFFPDGSSSGGEIRLEQGEKRYQISVIWISGKVKVNRHAPI